MKTMLIAAFAAGTAIAGLILYLQKKRRPSDISTTGPASLLTSPPGTTRLPQHSMG